jgi:hypothetical protein
VLVLAAGAHRPDRRRAVGARRPARLGRRRHPDAVTRARELARTVPVRLAVESGGAADPAERRLHLYLLAERWLDPDELEAANAALAERLHSDRVGDRGRLMRLPGTRNLKPGRPGRWCRILSADLHAPGVELHRMLGDRPLGGPVRPAPRGNGTRTGTGALDTLAPRDWFAVLESDRPITRFGYARCPLHDEEIPPRMREWGASRALGSGRVRRGRPRSHGSRPTQRVMLGVTCSHYRGSVPTSLKRRSRLARVFRAARAMPRRTRRRSNALRQPGRGWYETTIR